MEKRTILLASILLLFSLALFLKTDLTEAKPDKTPPTGSIVINNGDLYTTSTLVTLTLTASDPESGVKEVRYSNNDALNTHWEDFSETKSWTLTAGDGEKTVYYQIKNNDNRISTTYTDTIILNPQPTPSPEPTPSPTASPSPSPEPSPTPTATPQPTASPEPTPSPTVGPSPSPEPSPTVSPSPGPTLSPSPEPAITASPAPSLEPSDSASPTVAPQPTSPPEYPLTPSPSSESTLDSILTYLPQNEEKKLLVLSAVIVCGCILLFWSLKRKR